jgi:4-hydroxythreonine-4-phosphate dehydrogenase
MSSKRKKLRLAVSFGDPAGIGPEVTLKAFHLLSRPVRNSLTVFGDLGYFRRLNQKYKTEVNIVEAGKASASDDCLRVEPVCDLHFHSFEYGVVDKRCGAAAMGSLEESARLTLAGEFDALITPPIHKKSVNLAGYVVPGHTEFLSAVCGNVPVAMMLASPALRVVVATTHLALRDVASALTAKKLLDTMKLIDKSLTAYLGKKPRIAVCGLNPHAGDGGIFGDEEKRMIAPAIGRAVKMGIKATGPHPADSLFTPRVLKAYDVALAMYHDQGLIPVKTLGFGKTVNITLGLPFLRVSVDHGAAFDIAGKNMADAGPMAHAINTAVNILCGKF